MEKKQEGVKLNPEYRDNDLSTVHAYTFYCEGCKHRHIFFITGHIRWDFNGDLEKPTFTPSLSNISPKNDVCHLFLTDGKLHYLSDCTHELAGKTIDLPYYDF